MLKYERIMTMAKRKISDLEEMLAKRANDNVQTRISRFKAAIDKACDDLFGKTSCGTDKFGNYQYAEHRPDQHPVEFAKLTVLRMAVKDHERDPKTEKKTLLAWPGMLWETEIEALRNELLSKMDLLQQLLCSKSEERPDDVPRAT